MIQTYLKAFIDKNKFLLFLLVGLGNTIFGYSIFSLLIFLNFHYTLAVFCATCIGIIFNFKTTGIIVFKSHNNWLLWKFMMVYCIQYFLNIGCIKFLLLLNCNIYLAGAISIFSVSIVTYHLDKHFVFKETFQELFVDRA